MDPRHPELAIKRVKELISQYERVEADIRECTVSSKIAQLEREGGLVVQEICLVAPRIHEGLMQTSRQRRYDLSHGVVVDMSKYEVPDVIGEENIGGESRSVKTPHDGYLSVDEAIEEISTPPNQAETVEKPVKKPDFSGRGVPVSLVEEPVMAKLERPLTEEEGKKIVESISADKVDEPVERPVHKWSNSEKVVEAKKYLEQTITNSDVEKPVEKSYTEMAEVLDHSMTKEQEQVFEKMTEPKKKATRKKKIAKKAKK